MVIGRHAVPKAVGRSLMKRAIREVFRHLRGSLGSVDVVVRVRRPANRRELPEARHELENLLGKNR
jgi:ribonuclease P protein component